MALAAVLGAIANVLPPIATLLAIIWYIAMITDHYRSLRAERAAKILSAATHTADAVLSTASVTADAVLSTAATTAKTLKEKNDAPEIH